MLCLYQRNSQWFSSQSFLKSYCHNVTYWFNIQYSIPFDQGDTIFMLFLPLFQLSQQKQKHTRSLAERHYDKAIKLFKDLDHPTELLRVQLEKVALYEHIYQG